MKPHEILLHIIERLLAYSVTKSGLQNFSGEVNLKIEVRNGVAVKNNLTMTITP